MALTQREINMKGIIKDKHYAWIIMVACCAIRIGAYGIVGCSAGIYNSPVCTELGFKIGDFILASTIGAIAMMITQTFAGKIYKAFKMQHIFLVTGLLFFMSSFAMSFGKETWHWYVLATIQAIVGGYFYGSSLSVLICRWFFEKTAFALGIMDAFGFLAGMMVNPFVSKLILNVGWRNCYKIMAVIGAFISIPFVTVVVSDPEDAGLQAYGKNIASNEIKRKSGYVSDKQTYPLIAVGLTVFATICNASGGYYQHISSFCVSIGLGLMVGSIMSSCELGGVVLFKFIIDPILKKLGTIKTEVVLYMISFFSFLMFFINNKTVLYVAAFFSGVYSATNSVLLPIIAREQFGEDKYQDIVPLFSTGSGLFTALSSSLFGYLFDLTSSYTPMFIVCIICNTFSIGAILISRKIYKK